jgi:hypothetical protein
MATEKQTSMFAYQIRVNRGITREVFPDHMSGGANWCIRDAENWARQQDNQVLGDIIATFLDDKPELAVDQIKHLMK